MKKVKSSKSSKLIKYFFLISHGLPLLVTGLVMLIGKSFIITDQLYGLFIYSGLLSPTLAALFVLYYFYNKKERKEYWSSVFDFKRISLKWYVIIFSFPVLVRLAGAILDAALTANSFTFNISPDMTLLYGAILLFFGPIPEELGWRGIALPELQKRFSFRKAVIFLGFMWAIWHLPLFFVEGTYQNQMGLLTPMFWNFMLGAFFVSVVYAVIYNETKGSIFAVILFHYIGNLTGETFVMTHNAEIITTSLGGVIALLILVYYIKTKEE